MENFLKYKMLPLKDYLKLLPPSTSIKKRNDENTKTLKRKSCNYFPTDEQNELFDSDYELCEGQVEKIFISSTNNNELKNSQAAKIYPRLNNITLNLKALNKLVTENNEKNRINSNIIKSICKNINFEEDDLINIKLPAETIEELNKLERKCNLDSAFCSNLIIHLSKFKKGSNTYRNILKHLVNDKILLSYNWDGRNNKSEMKTMTIFNKVLRDACGEGFEENIRNVITLAKNLEYQKSNIKKVKEIKS